MKTPWTPWRDVVELREDLKSGELSLSMFAADLHDVMVGSAPPVYQDPREFFALTYPTFNLRELVKDVLLRLAGKNDKAVRQLELTYGGGKTHTLITLFHLAVDPDRLPNLPAVQDFSHHAGLTPPRARVAALVFDKLDSEKGAEVTAPNGERRWLKHPWSVLAFQIAGAKGLRLLHAEDLDAERDSPPAENLLVELLAMPEKEGLGTLILIDEVLTFARSKIDKDPRWHGRLMDFFQYLTQAATKLRRCAIVASLLATDPRKSDTLGKEITRDMYAIFRREREEAVQPVLKEDVAEILRRRFFKPGSIRDGDRFRPHVLEALKGIAALDEATHRDRKGAEERYLKSYPFHPDLTDVFYSKWTNLEGFQRTRGILRTFAVALRDAAPWDESPLVGANVLLPAPDRSGLSEAARDLATVAATEEYEGKRQEWTGILEGELAKAREAQAETPALQHREVEQALLATFLHSQPIGQKALTRELLLLVGHTRPDKIELEKALHRWAETSWFLDEEGLQTPETGPNGARQLPKSWRLGSKPNLRQMHHDARSRIPPEDTEATLLDVIAKAKSLTEGAETTGVLPNKLPPRPSDIADDGQFHYAILGPKAASDASRPSAEAKRYIDETTAADRPRVYRNSVVAVVPSRDGLEAARNAVRDHLGWAEVRKRLEGPKLDPLQAQALTRHEQASRQTMLEAVRQAYCIVVTLSERGEVEAFRLAMEDRPLFSLVKADKRSRIQETPISAEALLPNGPYHLWAEGEACRRVKDLVGAFAQVPHLPKMLNMRAILGTLVDGCREGTLVLRLVRPDRSVRTFWRQAPDEQALRDPALEAWLPQTSSLAELDPRLLAPGALPGLWTSPQITFKDLCAYFSAGHTVTVERAAGYSESVAIPQADREVLETAVAAAVRQGTLWLTCGTATLLEEDVPPGVLMDDAVLQAPPPAMSPFDVVRQKLLEAWPEETSTPTAIHWALSRKEGKNLPWATVRAAIDGALRARLLERAPGSAPWPCDLAAASAVKLRPSSQPLPPRPESRAPRAEADLRHDQVQQLGEQIPELLTAAVGLDLKFHVTVELGGQPTPPASAVAKINELLKEVSPDLQLPVGEE